MIIAVYPGTFDPLTRGHEDLVRRAAALFDKVVVGIAHSRNKALLQHRRARRDRARSARPLSQRGSAELRRPAQDFVRDQGGRVIVRGLRAVSDFEYEFQMAGMNRHLLPDVETLFMTPSDQYQFISGTIVREIAQLGGDVSKFVFPRSSAGCRKGQGTARAVLAGLNEPVPVISGRAPQRRPLR